MPVDVSGWDPVGSTSNTDYYRVAARVLAVIPRERATDTEQTALENLAFQRSWFERGGKPGTVVVFFDRLDTQDAGARRVYAAGTDPRWMAGSALVGGTRLSRAMASFFLGLSRPKVPTRLFGTVDEALRWADELNDAHDATSAAGAA